MIISVIFIFSALVLYTTSIFAERWIVGHLNVGILCLFVCGFISDLVGTSLMFYQAEIRLSFALHSIFGYLALIIMLAHLIWAILVVIKKVENYQYYFTKFSIYAWTVWIIAFLSGIPKANSAFLSWLSF